MPFYQSHGKLPPKRYTKLRRPNGGIYYEHLISAEGFDGEESLLYRLRPMTRILRSELLPPVVDRRWTQPITKNLLFKIEKIVSAGDYLQSRKPMLIGDSLVFYVAETTTPMEYFYRNAIADELLVIVQGDGCLETSYGVIEYRDLDLILIPRGDTVRLVCNDTPHILAVVESTRPIIIPRSFIKPNGQFFAQAPYHERDIRTPKFREPIDEEGEFPIVIKTGNQMSRDVLDHHPFDVVGWDGCCYPFALNMRDYEGLSSTIFLNPDQYKVFETDRTMMTCITPHRLAEHPEASPAQPFHQSLDFDEMLYRFSGSTGVTEPHGGTFTLHPRGIGHGPKPGFENQPRRTAQDAWGFMMDTRDILVPTIDAMAACDESYAETWITDQLRTQTAGPG